MKFLVVLCILAAISCAEVIDILKCLAFKPEIQEFVMKIIDIITKKEWTKIISLILESFTPIYNAVMSCI